MLEAPRLHNSQYFLIKVSWTGVHVFGHNRSIEQPLPGKEKDEE
jgi:hypothetical protein